MTAFKERILRSKLFGSQWNHWDIFSHSFLGKIWKSHQCFCNLFRIRFLDFKFCVQMEDTEVGGCTPGGGVGELLNTGIHSGVVESVWEDSLATGNDPEREELMRPQLWMGSAMEEQQKESQIRLGRNTQQEAEMKAECLNIREKSR